MAGLYFEEFRVGQVFDHPIRRTVTESDNVLISTLTHNPAALHLDEEYCRVHSEFGQRIVNSCLTLAFMAGMSHSEIGEIATDLADRYEGTNTSLSLPSTRVDAFNVTLADELARNGRRSGLTFAPEGGSERMRKVINKMVTSDDLIRTVTTAYAGGWRHVKLYFMCGLPTETDDDVLQIARMAAEVIRGGGSLASVVLSQKLK